MTIKLSIYQINDKKGNKLGLLHARTYLDARGLKPIAEEKYGKDIDKPIFLGTIPVSDQDFK